MADTLKMRACCNPPVQHPLEHELGAIKKKQKPKFKQSYSRPLQGGRGEGAPKPPRKTWGRVEEMGNLRRIGRRENEKTKR